MEHFRLALRLILLVTLLGIVQKMTSHRKSNTACLPLRCLSNQPKSQFQQPTSKKVEYRIVKAIGAGTFGKVYLVQNQSQQFFALKVVAQKNGVRERELEILKSLRHYNIVELKSFYTEPVHSYNIGGTTHYLNLVMEYIPMTLYQTIKKNRMSNQGLDKHLIKIYSFQLFKAFAYLQKQRICHRDLKPSNILIDPSTNVLKVCDFGSAKRIGMGEVNVSYICSRYYRAPELLLGFEKYDMAVDVWSIGCIMVEMLTGSPLFPGESSMEQMIEIVKIIGTPNIESLQKLYQTGVQPNLERVPPLCWTQILNQYQPEQTFVELIEMILCYDITARIKASEALSHPYFQGIKSQECLQHLSGNPNILVFDRN